MSVVIFDGIDCNLSTDCESLPQLRYCCKMPIIKNLHKTLLMTTENNYRRSPKEHIMTLWTYKFSKTTLVVHQEEYSIVNKFMLVIDIEVVVIFALECISKLSKLY